MPGTSAGSRRMVMRNRTISMRNPCLLFDERFELWRTTEALTVRALEQAGWTFWNRRNMAPYNKGPLAATGNIYLSYHIHFKAKWCQVHHLTSRMFPYCRDCWSKKTSKSRVNQIYTDQNLQALDNLAKYMPSKVMKLFTSTLAPHKTTLLARQDA